MEAKHPAAPRSHLENPELSPIPYPPSLVSHPLSPCGKNKKIARKLVQIKKNAYLCIA